jgi:hypothetical protein
MHVILYCLFLKSMIIFYCYKYVSSLLVHAFSDHNKPNDKEGCL